MWEVLEWTCCDQDRSNEYMYSLTITSTREKAEAFMDKVVEANPGMEYFQTSASGWISKNGVVLCIQEIPDAPYVIIYGGDEGGSWISSVAATKEIGENMVAENSVGDNTGRVRWVHEVVLDDPRDVEKIGSEFHHTFSCRPVE